MRYVMQAIPDARPIRTAKRARQIREGIMLARRSAFGAVLITMPSPPLSPGIFLKVTVPAGGPVSWS